MAAAAATAAVATYTNMHIMSSKLCRSIFLHTQLLPPCLALRLAGFLQQAAMLAAVSALVISLCLLAPGNAVLSPFSTNHLFFFFAALCLQGSCSKQQDYQHCSRLCSCIALTDYLLFASLSLLLLAGILQQAATLAAVSALVLSLCLSAPGNAAARVTQQQQQQQQSLQETQYMLQLPQQQQQQQQVVASSSRAFFVTTSSSSSSSSGTGLQAMAAPNQQQQQGQLLFSVGSQIEDGMLEVVRQLEAQVDRAFGAVSSGVHMIDAAQASSEQVKQVWLLLFGRNSVLTVSCTFSSAVSMFNRC
jgi:hypothetical protein